MPDEQNKRNFNSKRSKILLYGGLLGIFIYMAIVEFSSSPFHFEFILGFLAMMGVSIAQGVDKQ